MKVLHALFGAGVVVAALIAGAAPASANASSHTSCASGTLASGTYRTVTVSGDCAIPDGKTVTIRGQLILERGAQLNAITASTVHVTGNILVGPGARLGLGCSFGMTLPAYPGGPVFCPKGVSHDRVDGSIIGAGPLTLVIDGISVGGSIVSYGGGQSVTGPDAAACEEHAAPLNFPIKDNTIGGNVIITGWHGCWAGVIRDVVGGNVIFFANHTASSDSNEIVTNQIRHNLICAANAPAPQIGDSGGAPNVVGGHKIGQCAAL